MEVDSKIIKETQLSLGKHVKKPQLTEKLLQKPPFRYLHDIVKAVIRDTGFLDGLFTPDELDYEKVKEKESKIAFLNKLINVVKLASGIDLTVKPSKIVSGQEANRTNELLQAIAVCIEKKIESDGDQKTDKAKETKEEKPAVRKDSVGGKKEPLAAKKPAAREATKKPPLERKNTFDKKDVKSESTKGTKTKEVKAKTTSKTTKAEAPKKKGEKAGKGESKKEVVKQVSVEATPPDSDTKPSLEDPQPESLPREPESLPREPESIPMEQQPESEPNKEVVEVEEKRIEPAPVVLEVAPEKPVEKQKESPKKVETVKKASAGRRQSTTDAREASALKGKFIKTSSEDKITRLRPPSVRPPSARPGAPKRRDKNIELALPPEEPKTQPEIKIDAFDVELEDNVDNLVIIEDPTVVQDEIFAPKLESGEGEGHLVQQILETQREFSNVGAEEAQYESPFDNRRISSAKTEALREAIQKLTKNIHPLGKLLDFMQEDVDSMQIELTQHLQMYQTALADLEQERSQTEAVIQPFKQQLAQLDENIKFYEATILDARSSILSNELKINKKMGEF